MALPFFFTENITHADGIISLPEETSRHIVQVLRMKSGELINLTDGKGNVVSAAIGEAHKKKSTVQILDTKYIPRQKAKLSIAISLVKNTSRFEWFLEKAAEIGITEIIPLLCTRTEKQQFRFDRMQQILVSAMLQSQQAWLTELKKPASFHETVEQCSQSLRYVAHCLETEKKSLPSGIHTDNDVIILIGPEGDFTTDEIELALANQFIPVSLGTTRLRTETAGMVAAVLLGVR